MPFNLIRDPWLPVLDGSGRRGFIRPSQVAESSDSGPWLSFDTGRPELDMACLEFVIGLMAVACPPETAGDFARWFEAPPSAGDLDAIFEPLVPAFDLDASQGAFMQDPLPTQLEVAQPIHELLLVSGSGELFFTPSSLTGGVDRDVRFGRMGVAIALFAHQITSPSGGRGYRTSPRGGGPLTTVLVPYGADKKPLPLWHRAWLNVPREEAGVSAERDLAWFFPWMRPSEGFDFVTKVIPCEGVDPTQVLFPMPRRVVIDWEPNTDRLPCDLTGHVDEVVARSFRRVHGGLDYPSNVWRHPLTPRYRPKATIPETLPVRPKAGHDTLGDWVALTFGRSDGSREAAPIVNEWIQRRREVVPDVKLQACGFAMESAKVEDWIDRTIPVVRASDPKVSDAVMRLAEGMADTCEAMGYALKSAVKGATYSERAEVGGVTALAGIPIRLVQDVRPHFFAALERVLACPADEDAIKADWLRRLGSVALSLYDDLRPIQQASAKDLPVWIKHGRFLGATARGTSPAGGALWKAMGLTPPEKTVKRNAPKGDRKEEGMR